MDVLSVPSHTFTHTLMFHAKLDGRVWTSFAINPSGWGKGDASTLTELVVSVYIFYNIFSPPVFFLFQNDSVAPEGKPTLKLNASVAMWKLYRTSSGANRNSFNVA
jgi:hypothetical protein